MKDILADFGSLEEFVIKNFKVYKIKEEAKTKLEFNTNNKWEEKWNKQNEKRKIRAEKAK